MGADVVFSVPALEADGICRGPIGLSRTPISAGTWGSGIQKMLVIGFGKQVGANNAHCAAAHLGYEVVLRGFAKTVLGAVPVLCGIALLEDQHHQTAEIAVLRKEDIVAKRTSSFRRRHRCWHACPSMRSIC